MKTVSIKMAPCSDMRCHFPSNHPSCQLNLLISNLSTQPTHFASCQLDPTPFFHVDMFPMTVKTAFFGRVISCPKSVPPRKSLIFKAFSYIYFLTLDIKHTTSTQHERTGSTSVPLRSVRLNPPLIL